MNNEKYLSLLKQCLENPDKMEIFLIQLYEPDHPIFEFPIEKQVDFVKSCVVAMTKRGYTYRKRPKELTPLYQERAELVISALAATTVPLNTRQLSEFTDMPITWLYDLLIKMVDAGQVGRKGIIKFLYFCGDFEEDKL